MTDRSAVRRARATAALLSLAAAGCVRSATPAPALAGAPGALPDSGAFVTLLGADTIAGGRFVRTARRVEADVVLRVPTTLRTRYVLELDSAGNLARLESVTTDPQRAGGATVRRQVLTRSAEWLHSDVAAGGQSDVRMVEAPIATLPFIDMVHWPYEIALVHARASGGLPAALPLLTGARVSRFPVAAVGTDSATITHPSRGTMRVRLDARGRLLGLDAGQTTRKLRLARRPWMSVDSSVARWAALDAAGRGLGALSGRAEERQQLGDATLVVDYGTPAKRGRAIWGALVRFGEVWRTGANEATHLTTDRAIVLGAGADTLVVPAGRYTLFSIPARDGGMLIVNRQTGQGGTTYDAARDLGRVRLVARALPAPVELFTIRVGSTGAASGELRLQWDDTELVVPVRVREGA
ncbi:MAG TPA: DUF2911 domain-containing protein [Gemmatimonadaceae bacterium]|nr:DUF2911 domain-containing protein [Gemmatimonadaceae bacterium]